MSHRRWSLLALVLAPLLVLGAALLADEAGAAALRGLAHDRTGYHTRERGAAARYFSFSTPANFRSGLSSWRTAASSGVVVSVTIRARSAPTPGPSM